MTTTDGYVLIQHPMELEVSLFCFGVARLIHYFSALLPRYCNLIFRRFCRFQSSLQAHPATANGLLVDKQIFRRQNASNSHDFHCVTLSRNTFWYLSSFSPFDFVDSMFPSMGCFSPKGETAVSRDIAPAELEKKPSAAEESKNLPSLQCINEPTLYDVILPGTHDSGAYKIDPYLVNRGGPKVLGTAPMGFSLKGVFTSFSKTQELDIYGQLKAGARYLDMRVSKVQSKKPEEAKAFYIHHGINVCYPLAEFLDGINRFHEENGENKKTIIVGTAVDYIEQDELPQLVDFVKSTLKHSIFDGSPEDIRKTPLKDLPHTIINGIPGIGSDSLDRNWGVDRWINTYDFTEKRVKLSEQVKQEVALRDRRDSMYVLGWTVTPQWYDIAGRVATVGIARPSLSKKASEFNQYVKEFIDEHKEEMKDRVNVIFFDFFTKELGDMVNELNDTLCHPLDH